MSTRSLTFVNFQVGVFAVFEPDEIDVSPVTPVTADGAYVADATVVGDTIGGDAMAGSLCGGVIVGGREGGSGGKTRFYRIWRCRVAEWLRFCT